MMAGQGSLVTIDAGADSGVAPGNIFTVYRIIYPSVPSPRNVLGELAVLVREGPHRPGQGHHELRRGDGGRLGRAALAASAFRRASTSVGPGLSAGPFSFRAEPSPKKRRK